MYKVVSTLAAAFVAVVAYVGALGAQWNGCPPGFCNIRQATNLAVYVGPGDIVAGANAWYGLRAYSAADNGNRLVNVCDPGNANCVDFVSNITTGKLVFQTVGSTDCTSVNTCTIKVFYDRSGANKCSSSACNMTQITAGSRCTLKASCLGGLPCAVCLNSSYTTPGTFATQAQPYTMSGTINRTAPTGSSQGILSDTGTNATLFGDAGGGQINIYAGFTLVGNATDNLTHAAQGVFNGSSSVVYIDGTSATGNAGTSSLSSGLILDPSFGGNLFEVGLWPGAFSVGNQSSMNVNQHTYWGF